MSLKYGEIEQLKNGLKNLKSMGACDAVTTLMVFEKCQVASLNLLVLQFMKRFRENVKDTILTSTMDIDTYWAFRGSQTIGQVCKCFSVNYEKHSAAVIEVIETMEALVLLLVAHLEIPDVAQAELEEAIKRAEMLAVCEIMEAVLKARAKGMTEQQVMALVNIFSANLPAGVRESLFKMNNWANGRNVSSNTEAGHEIEVPDLQLA